MVRASRRRKQRSGAEIFNLCDRRSADSGPKRVKYSRGPSGSRACETTTSALSYLATQDPASP